MKTCGEMIFFWQWKENIIILGTWLQPNQLIVVLDFEVAKNKCFYSFIIVLDKGDWLQVDFGNPVYLLGVITQGRATNFNQWMTKYKISYGNTTNELNIIKKSNGEDEASHVIVVLRQSVQEVVLACLLVVVAGPHIFKTIIAATASP